MIESVNLFEGHVPFYKITKPVKLIELFAGIGSQHQALKNLGVKIEHSTIVEWQVNSIQAYNDIHVRKYDDHTQGLDKQELANRLSRIMVCPLITTNLLRLESLLRKER
jgi:site-specific DNA-cytosine methylase